MANLRLGLRFLFTIYACVCGGFAGNSNLGKIAKNEAAEGYSKAKETDGKATVYSIEAQPRMYTSGGHLIFQTGDTYNISFKTSGQGSLNLNDVDLDGMTKQVVQNQQDINDIKVNGGVSTDIQEQVDSNAEYIVSLQSQVNDHNSKIGVLRTDVDALQISVGAISSDLGSNECSSRPCLNGGTCIDLYKSYLCQCVDQYQGPTCAVDVNECNTLAAIGAGCQNGGTCENLVGTFRCHCPPEYSGTFCTSKEDDCSDGNAKCDHGVCVDAHRDQPGQPKYSCVCGTGWQATDGSTDPACNADIDECLAKPCSKNPEVTCYNNPGSYSCGPCPSGYNGNGWACTDIDECATQNGGCSVAPLVTCFNTAGSFMCGSCPGGYTGDGVVCTPQDPCTVDNGGCHPIATCLYNPAISAVFVSCQCPPGYTGNGFGPNGCSLSSNDCVNSCQNGQCVNDGSGGQICQCDPGWTGGYCETNINECSSSPCLNGGTCSDGVNGYSCSCQANFAGVNCEVEQSGCGGYYQQDTGSFSYPGNTGQDYLNNKNCAWVIEVSSDKVVEANFPLFDIEFSTNCLNDFLQIHDGRTASDHKIGTFCGTTPPGDPLVSTHNYLYFWFISNAQTTAKGFQVAWQTSDPVCGGDISGQTFGDVKTPGYPGNYPSNSDCYWTITVQPGYVIQLLFASVNIEDHDTCANDYVEIRNGLTELDPVLARYCSTISPPPLVTTSPGVWIYFHSDASQTDSGFHIAWNSQPVSITGCGGYFDDDDGIVISPNWPNSYNELQECYYQIHLKDSGLISLEFSHMDIQDDSNCLYDYLEVRDGPDERAPLVARHCGGSIPPPFTSSSNDLWMKFKSDDLQQGSGFRATYTVQCGGTYTDETGSIMSPYYPELYPDNKDCYYVIRQELGHQIVLTFTDFQLEDQSDCNFEYIEIRDGSSESSPVLKKLCSNNALAPVQSSANYMWIHFASDSSSADTGQTGFMATYTSTYTGCDGVYTEPTGVLLSPGHPTPYPHGATCVYYINVDPAFIINFQFISFSLELADDQGICGDYVEVFDGPSNSSASIGRYCGPSIPPAVVSNGNTLTIYFVADTSINSDGFVAAYSTIDSSNACGKRIDGNTGQVTSPNYPGNYNDARSCVWILKVDDNMQIKVNFTDFELESVDNYDSCSLDYLEIRNGGYDTSSLIGTFCGNNNPGSFTTHSNQLYMKLVTNNANNYRGFSMNYAGSLTGCGGLLTSSTGFFQSPNFPYPYNHNTECYWLIKVAEGSIVRLVFTTFDLKSYLYCEYDYVEMFDGPTQGYPSLGRECRDVIPSPYASTDNQMYVKFRTDSESAGTGFQAQYVTECSRTISGKSSGRIQSLDYPQNYPPNRDCTWIVEGTYGNKINVSFSYFAMQTCDNCHCDYVALYDGDDFATSPLIGKHCSSAPSPLQTTSNYLTVQFHTDQKTAAPGFEILWAVDGCGKHYTAPNGTITSPNYPNNYDDNRECIWQITTSPGTSVQLTVTVFDVEHHVQCDFDALFIYNGLSADSHYLLATLCNTDTSSHNLPMVVTSTSSFMTLRFLTDPYVNGQGFSSNFQEVVGQCGGSIKTSSGAIMSPNYPQVYPPQQDCRWVIDVTQGSTVALYFEAFEIEPSTSCTYDYVAVYDGEYNNGTLLLKTCGSTIPDPVFSSGHIMTVLFYSDQLGGHTGFRATFSSTCGGSVIAYEDGSIQSPNYPALYPANTTCTWQIQAPQSDGHITLTFTHMDLWFDAYNFNGTCEIYDYIEVRDGIGLSSPLVGTLCSTFIPTPLVSSSNSYTVTMFSKSISQKTGFMALYSASTSRCGGEFTAAQGRFNSPNYPSEYPISSNCVWIIKSSPGNRIALRFLSMDIEPHSGCLWDYVQVREGSLTGTILAQYCGTTVPANLTSINGHILYVIFHSDNTGVAQGFQAEFTHDYGGTSTGYNGSIASPMYPYNYPDVVNAYYYVYAPFGDFISYTFSLFDIEFSDLCEWDFLSIHDGDSINAPLLSLSCGNDFLPPPATTTQGVLFLWFRSDYRVSGRGFYMDWVAVPGAGIDPNPTNVPTIPPGQCGAPQLVAAIYPIYIHSPGYPIAHPSNLNCIWVIEAAAGFTVTFTFVDFEMEGYDTCGYDHVNFYNGPTIESTFIGQFCGKVVPPDPIKSTSNFLTVQMTTDPSLNYAGFNASYQQGCGGVITADYGVILSPNYPNQYQPDTTCTWFILSTFGSNITVTFIDPFQIINSDPLCQEIGGDYIKLLNGRDLDSPPLANGDGNGFYCGNNAPQGLTTLSNAMVVIFDSDGANSGSGFSLTFTSQAGSCGGDLTLTHQINELNFESPNYPSPYPDGIDCYWVLSAPATESVRVDFLVFNVPSNTNCESNFLLAIDGRTGGGQVLGKFCGNQIPPTVKSLGNEMIVQFRNNPTTGSYGFQAIVSISTCGGTLTGLEGEITSPEFPSTYPTSTSCQWVVRGPMYHFMIFTFETLDLDSSDSCGNGVGDYIEFRQFNFTGPLIATVCGNTPPTEVDSLTNEAYITFVSDGNANTGGGFKMNYVASEDVCGDDFTTSGGVFSTPNYPNSYDHSRICTWTIRVADDRSVTVTFNAFAIEDPHADNNYCYWDYVEIFNGINPNSPSLTQRICGTNLPAPVTSSGPTMKVVFTTDGSVSNGGFLATYDSNQPRFCGGTLNSPDGGLFSSPNYPANYPDSTECTWIVENRNSHNSTMLITFDDFALENHVVCDYDLFIVKAGVDYNGFQIGEYCGRTIPAPIGIAYPQSFVQFVSDVSVGDKGFNATYQFTNCGGYVVGSSGVITTPNYPEVYDHDDYCLWTIAVAKNHKVNLFFTDFEIELHSNCFFDYLKIFNGPTVGSPLVDTYCGDNEPTTFQSGSNLVTLLFESDYSVSKGGFRVEWSADNTGCGNVIYHDMTGTVTSPNYPLLYPTNADCIWQIIVDRAYHLEITFNDQFNIESHSSCNYDYVAIFDGVSEYSPSIGRFCGDSLSATAPPDEPVVSSIHEVTLRFRSDISTQKMGFQAYWDAQCGQIITTLSGIIQSPNYPDAYNNNENCQYLISYDDDLKFIKLEFTAFSIESGSEITLCDFDYVKVFGHLNSDGSRSLIGSYCGNIPPTTPLSAQGNMLIEFSADPSTVGYGFQAKYESSDCGGMLNESSGQINAFTHSDIHNNRNCTWQIQVSPTQRIIELKFSSFDLEGHSNCIYDYVKIYDGFDTNAPLIGTFCGHQVPVFQMTTGNTMTIEYITDDLITGNGFEAGYRATVGPYEGCGGTLTQSSGIFTSVDLDNSGEYDSNLNCLWLIETGVNTIINLQFTEFKLENASSSTNLCRYDSVTVIDGISVADPVASVSCGLVVPAPFTSSSNQLYVRFISDSIIEDTGFSATYTTQPQTCGGIYAVTDNFQSLVSPIIDGQSQAQNCRWTLDVGLDTSKYVYIVFDALDIQSTSNPDTSCTSSYVELRDYPLGDFGQTIKYCGSKTPLDFHSFGQIVQVNYRTDIGASGNGFSIRYQTTGCSKQITQPYGQLFSPGWPDPYAHNLDCETSINVDPGSEIQIFFNYFDIEFEGNCTFDYIEIRKGTDVTAPLLLRACGTALPDPVFVQSSTAYIRLVTDPYIEGRGYDITYTSSPNSCGGNITGDHGIVYSTLYPQPYQPNTDCFYSIRTPAGRPTTIHITFIDIYYECNDDGCKCVGDFLHIYGGPTLSSPIISSYCGYGTLTDLQSPTNGAGVRLTSSDFTAGSRTNSGFRVDFES